MNLADKLRISDALKSGEKVAAIIPRRFKQRQRIYDPIYP